MSLLRMALLAVCFLLPAVRPGIAGAPWDGKSCGDIAHADDTVNFAMQLRDGSQVRLSMPASFFATVSPVAEGSVERSKFFRISLEDLRPLSFLEFVELGKREKVILYHVGDRVPVARNAEIVARIAYGPGDYATILTHETDYGLFTAPPDNVLRWYDVFLAPDGSRLENGVSTVVTCSQKTDRRKAICSHYFEVPETPLGANITYDKVHLPDWRMMEARAHAILECAMQTDGERAGADAEAE